MRPRPTEVKCEKSSRLTMVPREGYWRIWLRALEKMMEWGMVMCLYSTPRVAECRVRQVNRQDIKSTFRGVYPFGGISRARCDIISSSISTGSLSRQALLVTLGAGRRISSTSSWSSFCCCCCCAFDGSGLGTSSSHAHPLAWVPPSRRRSL